MRDGYGFQEVEDFFEVNQTVGLELPDGWFGRPFDNQYHFVSADYSDDEMTIEFGPLRTILRFSGRTRATRDDGLLVLTGFEQLVFEASIVGSSKVHSRRYEDGEVKIHAMAWGNKK